jgi:hypothetical protein
MWRMLVKESVYSVDSDNIPFRLPENHHVQSAVQHLAPQGFQPR